MTLKAFLASLDGKPLAEKLSAIKSHFTSHLAAMTGTAVQVIESLKATVGELTETLAEQVSQIAQLTTERDAANRAAEESKITADGIQAQLTAKISELATAQSTLATAQSEVTRTKAEVDNLTTNKSMQQLRAVGHDALPPETADETGRTGSTSSLEQIREQLKTETDPVKRGQLARQARALREGTK